VQADFLIEERVEGVVVGVDEAGRGPLAGPVIAAAIILDRSDPNIQKLGINDSKKLSALKRESIYNYLVQKCHYAVGEATVEEIDTLNILQATMLAMRRAIEGILIPYNHVLVDGNQRPLHEPHVQAVIGGDAQSLTIAAASILAKVKRDALMLKLAEEYPDYLWHKNKGYPSTDHRQALIKYGPCPHHRRSFLRKILG
jgi:ribonuclease HII